mmetsp:Transcript_65454/g.161180  ORF Transcript_65454/g.161180 Transcript_65454/m.161180 type:complete len:522 (-) Transcript_65454:90-1655(-)
MKSMSLKNHFVGEDAELVAAFPEENGRPCDEAEDFCFVEGAGDGQSAPVASKEMIPGISSGGAAKGEEGGLSGDSEPAWVDRVQGWEHGDAVESEEDEDEDEDKEDGCDVASRSDLSATETLSSMAFMDVASVPPQRAAPAAHPRPKQAPAATSSRLRAVIQLLLSPAVLARIGTTLLGFCFAAALCLLAAHTLTSVGPILLGLSTTLAHGLADSYSGVELRSELSAVPAEYFSPARRGAVHEMFPRHQFLVFGLHGAGKSTMLQNLALHAGLAPHEVRQFSVARGGGLSFTPEVKKARFGAGVAMLDSKGLPDWNILHIDTLDNLVSGKTKVGCPMHWDLPEYKEVQEVYTDCEGCVLWCWRRTRTKQVLVEPRRAGGSSAYDCDSKLAEPVRGGAVHAALLIVRYPSEEEYSSANAQAKRFLRAMRDRMPQLFPVVAVTHLDGCVQRGRSAQACSDELAEDMGFTELGSVFPLEAVPNLDPRIQADKSLSASQLTPIIRTLRYKAYEFYNRRLPQDEDL